MIADDFLRRFRIDRACRLARDSSGAPGGGTRVAPRGKPEDSIQPKSSISHEASRSRIWSSGNPGWLAATSKETVLSSILRFCRPRIMHAKMRYFKDGQQISALNMTICNPIFGQLPLLN